MATLTRVEILDDLNGALGAETVTFALDGATYEIDLSDENKQRLNNALAEYIAAGRRVKSSGKPSGKKKKPSTAAQAENARIREWALQNGHTLGDRGRIKKEIRDSYHAAMSQKSQEMSGQPQG